MPDHFIFTRDDVLSMLDTLLQTGADAWWDDFFADRSKPCPFFTEWPDENLAEWFNVGLLAPGRVLELGCGNGRNATYLAGLGCSVDAVDFSVQAIQWARERANRASAPVAFQRCSIFDAQFTDGSYDLVYDSGCFHHVPPHRRKDYANLVHRALRPGGSYGLVCFRPEGGSGYTDQQVYEQASLGGGLGYSEDRLRALWDKPPFSVRVIRQMNRTDARGPYFGEDFLWALLAMREGAPEGRGNAQPDTRLTRPPTRFDGTPPPLTATPAKRPTRCHANAMTVKRVDAGYRPINRRDWMSADTCPC